MLFKDSLLYFIHGKHYLSAKFLFSYLFKKEIDLNSFHIAVFFFFCGVSTSVYLLSPLFTFKFSGPLVINVSF